MQMNSIWKRFKLHKGNYLLIDFNGTSNHQGLFNDVRLMNRVYFTFIFSFAVSENILAQLNTTKVLKNVWHIDKT